MDILAPSDERRVEQYSSVDQFEGFLGIFRQHKVVPLVYDVLEWGSCDTLKTHRAILCLDDSYNGFIYPVATCLKETETVLLTDKQGTGIKTLPCQYGENGGTYEKYIDEYVATVADNEVLGTKNKARLRVGLNYYKAKKTLPSVA